MNKTMAITLVILGSLVLLGLVFGAGLMIGHFNFSGANNQPYGMMHWYDDDDSSFEYGRMGRDYNHMDLSMPMGRWGVNTAASADPITIAQAETAFTAYLAELDDADLELSEIMIFDNNAYARISEKSTGIGAMELLLEPGTLNVHPEYGPNMMWNLKYGHMSNTGMMGGFGGHMGGGMMGGYDSNTNTDYTEMTVSEDQALEIAQEYLDEQYPGYQTADEAYAFYGYYTLDFLEDGTPVGMLSVNGYTGQVFLHTWHGTFLEMVE
ncbi:MAG: hypothetical protein JEZ00_17425 [Anaerolineaceae bacterium]|nr:hypothetical protein [Anaerolineaceae bacterium]